MKDAFVMKILFVLSSIIFGVCGFTYLIQQNWRIALAVFFILWGNNIGLRLDRKD